MVQRGPFLIEEATPKQKQFAKEIAQQLGLELPPEESKQAYARFISEHLEDYNRERPRPVRAYRYRQRRLWPDYLNS